MANRSRHSSTANEGSRMTDLYNHLVDLQPSHPGIKRFRHSNPKNSCCIECRLETAFGTYGMMRVANRMNISISRLYLFVNYYKRRQRMAFIVHPITEGHFPIFRKLFKAFHLKPHWFVYGPAYYERREKEAA